MDFIFYYLPLTILGMLSFSFSALEKAILITNKFRFKHFYPPSSRLNKWAYQVIDASPESLKIAWFGKALFLLTLSFVIVNTMMTKSGTTFNWQIVGLIFVITLAIELISKAISESIPIAVIISGSPLIVFFKPLFLSFIRIANSISTSFSVFLRSDQSLNALFIKQDLRTIILQSKQEGKVLEKDIEIVANLFEVRNILAKEVMVPRKEIQAVSKRSSIREVKQKFMHLQLSRLMVYDDTIDNIVGYIELQDMFKQPRRLTEIIRSIFFIPESRKLFDILQDFFRRKNDSIAVVVDEYGGTTGIISVADLTEELTGEVKSDGGDRRKKGKTEPLWKDLGKGIFELNGKLKTEVLKEEVGIDISGDEYETVAGFILHKMQRIPTSGEKFTYKNYHFTILTSEKTQIKSIKLKI